jgi:hypothetical protein
MHADPSASSVTTNVRNSCKQYADLLSSQFVRRCRSLVVPIMNLVPGIRLCMIQGELVVCVRLELALDARDDISPLTGMD